MARLAQIAKALLGALAVTALTAAAPTPLTAHGWGALKIGMPAKEALRVMGPSENTQEGTGDGACDEFVPRRAPDMVVMIEHGRVSRIAIWNRSPILTDAGIGLRAKEADVRHAYRNAVKVQTAAYTGEPAHFLTHWEHGGRLGLKYETDIRGRVTAIYAGTRAIQYIEGCL
jgi:hypothetical protein